jgi:hypothetical protein
MLKIRRIAVGRAKVEDVGGSLSAERVGILSALAYEWGETSCATRRHNRRTSRTKYAT